MTRNQMRLRRKLDKKPDTPPKQPANKNIEAPPTHIQIAVTEEEVRYGHRPASFDTHGK